MQVQLRQEAPDLLGASLERRQQPTLEALGQPAHPRPAHGERPAAQAHPARLAEAIAIAHRRIDGLAPLVAPPAQQAVHLFLQQPLQELLHALPRERLQRLPGGA